MGVKLVLTGAASVAAEPDLLGGKAANLVKLLEAGLQVPEWMVLTTGAFESQLRQWQMQDWLAEQLTTLKNQPENPEFLTQTCQHIQQKIIIGQLSPELVNQLKQGLEEAGLSASEFLAVRSSVVGEDAVKDSFAGQMESYLFRKGPDQLAEAIKNCWASAFSERAIRYRLQKQIPVTGIKAGIIIQRMINGEVSGVLFTANPVTGSRKEALLTATYGLGEGLVSGACNADEFTVSLPEPHILSRTITQKDTAFQFDTSAGFGTAEKKTSPEAAASACLPDAVILRLVTDGYKLARLLGAPQDIEWTISGEKIYYLQTRPVTQLPPVQPPVGKRIVWNNSNIQESYLGVTTPLTFSFASMAYARVYTDTMRLMGISEKIIADHQDMLQNLLGLLNGRVYYNINNWYRGLLLLPKFKTNKADMERMMGLQEAVDFIQDRELSLTEKLGKLPGLTLTFSKLLVKFNKIGKLVQEFQERFSREYNRIDRQSLHTLQLPELMQLIRQFETDMLGHWQTPIINDFYVMMYNGKVKRHLVKTGLENPVSLQNNLLSGEPGIESTEPTLELMRLAAEVRKIPALQAIFEKVPNNKLLPALHLQAPGFHQQCLGYLHLYGDRCMGELKLESVSLRQDPSFMFAVIRNFMGNQNLTPESLRNKEQKLRNETEKLVFDAIRKNAGIFALHRFRTDLNKFRQGVKNRENMRLARTRMFGLFRDIYLEIGQQLALQNLLPEPRDVFYLTVEELKAFDEGRSVNADLAGITAVRKAEFATYEAETPPNHLETSGTVYPLQNHLARQAAEQQSAAEFTGNTLKGLGCYPGLVNSRIKLIFSPQDELSVNNQILCTVRTDPGWAPLFPTCSGLIVERGSTLSHSAVVARELGIPAIVGVPGVTAILKTGDLVSMNGASGEIEILEQHEV